MWTPASLASTSLEINRANPTTRSIILVRTKPRQLKHTKGERAFKRGRNPRKVTLELRPILGAANLISGQIPHDLPEVTESQKPHTAKAQKTGVLYSVVSREWVEGCTNLNLTNAPYARTPREKFQLTLTNSLEIFPWQRARNASDWSTGFGERGRERERKREEKGRRRGEERVREKRGGRERKSYQERLRKYCSSHPQQCRHKFTFSSEEACGLLTCTTQITYTSLQW